MHRALEALVAASRLGEAGAPMGDVALALTAGGWLVFPCGQDKAPLVSGGFKSRTSDRQQVCQWWITHPDAMPAIVPGDQGLAALDIDSTKAARAVDEAGLWEQGGADCFVVATAGTSPVFEFKGMMRPPQHSYIWANVQPDIPGVVVRYRAGYVIAPGASRSGRIYRVISEGEPLRYPVYGFPTVSPDTVSDHEVDPERVRAAALCVPNSEDVSREQYVAMAHMIQGALGDDGRDIFLEWAGRYPGADADEDARVFDTLPPSRLGWKELWRLAADHGFDAAPEIDAEARANFTSFEPGIGYGSGSDDPRKKVQFMLDAVQDAQDGIDRARALRNLRAAGFSEREVRLMLAELAPVESDEGLTLEELLQSPELLKEPEPALPFLAWPGMKTMFASREKMGKSTLAMAAVAAATHGREFLGVRVPQQRVLWLSEEPLGIFARRAQLFDVEPRHAVIVGMAQNPMAQLRRALKKHSPQIVVIDTLFRFACIDGDGENDSGSWLPILLQFDEVTRGGVALLLLHHSLKSSEGGQYRGSSAIGGFVDAILEMKQPAKAVDRIRRISGRGRLSFGQPFNIKLLPDDKTFALVDDVEARKAALYDRKAFEFVLENPGCTSNAVGKAIGGSKGDAPAALRRLTKEGFVIDEGDQNRSKWRALKATDAFDGAVGEEL